MDHIYQKPDVELIVYNVGNSILGSSIEGLRNNYNQSTGWED